MKNFLVEMKQWDLPKLKNLYKPDGPKNNITYTTIDNYIRWFKLDPKIKHIKFYCLGGDFSDGTFVVTDRNSAYADTLNGCTDRLFKLLTLIDFSKGYSFKGVRPGVHTAIFDAIEYLGVEIEDYFPSVLYYCPREKAQKFDIEKPNNIELRPLKKSCDLAKVNSVWPHRDSNSFTYLERITRYNPSIGAYRDDGTLVAWMLRIQTGLLGTLQTDKKYLGHGYGSLVTKALSKIVAEMGYDLNAAVLENNIPSRKLFEKLGYELVGEIHWITTLNDWSPADE